MLPLDPPLSRGARPGWMNRDRPFDDAALARFDRNPESPAARARFARHLVQRDPENVWALMILAGDARSAVERMALLREAVRVGLRGWAPHLSGRLPAPDWGSDPDAAPFMAGVLAYGVCLMKDGHRDEAAECLRFLTRLDPADSIGAVEVMAAVGVVGPGASPGPGRGPTGG